MSTIYGDGFIADRFPQEESQHLQNATAICQSNQPSDHHHVGGSRLGSDREDALTPEILAGVIDRACACMQAAKARGDVQMARRYFRRICRLQGLAETIGSAT